MQKQETWASAFCRWRDVMEETHHCSPTVLITSGKGRDNHDTHRDACPSRKHRDISTLPVYMLSGSNHLWHWLLEELEVLKHLLWRHWRQEPIYAVVLGPVEVTWGGLGGSEYPWLLALGHEAAQCIFTSVKSIRRLTKILVPVLEASFIGNHEPDMWELHGLGDISCNNSWISQQGLSSLSLFSDIVSHNASNFLFGVLLQDMIKIRTVLKVVLLRRTGKGEVPWAMH